MGVPTRLQIQNKIYEVVEDVNGGIESWLNAMECPQEDKEKILSDLESYARE